LIRSDSDWRSSTYNRQRTLTTRTKDDSNKIIYYFDTKREATMANTNTNDKKEEQKTYKQAAGEYYNQKYETWMPWIEDKYLSWFTKDNKASYATKRMSTSSHITSPSHLHPTYTPYLPFSHTPQHELTQHLTENLDKTKVTGVSQIDQAQDGVNGLVSGTIGQGGLAQPLGDAMSKEGINRAERGGKDEHGNTVESQGPLGGYGASAAEGVKSGAGSVAGGVKGAGGYVGGMLGGGGKEEKK
jgi:hypothetical protein